MYATTTLSQGDVTANNVSLKAMPFLRELSMEAYLIENPDVLALDEEDLADVSVLDAEIPVPEGRKARHSDGRIDLLAAYGDSVVATIELKLGQLTLHHLSQLEEYLARTDHLGPLLASNELKQDNQWIGVLVGTSLSSELRSKIEDGYLASDTYPIAALALSRYRGSDNNIYVVTDTVFRNIGRKLDRSRYRFEAEVLGKNRLVLAVIQRYAADHPGLSFQDLLKAFPKELQGSSGCFSPSQDAEEVCQRTGHKRHFLKPEERIQLSNAEVAVSTQWSIRSIAGFISRAKQNGFHILEVEPGADAG